MSIQSGQRIRHYAIEEELAKGSMGMVWQAWDVDQHARVAIKVLAHDTIGAPEFKLRIQDEANRHQRLRHPNIVPILEVFEAEGATCIVMPLIEGQSLARLLESRPNQRLTVAEALSILTDMLQALDYAHQSGIVHRDIKPSNILLEQDGRAKLINFGIALAVGEQRVTRMGQLVGTPEYMSPEQIVKPSHIDHRSDIYSVGCVLYEMLTGRPPFVGGNEGVGNTDFAVQQAHVHTQPKPPRERVPDIPGALDALTLVALAKDPDKRASGCRELLRLVQMMETGEPLGRDVESKSTRHASDEGAVPETRRLQGVWLKLGILLLVTLLVIWLATLIEGP